MVRLRIIMEHLDSFDGIVFINVFDEPEAIEASQRELISFLFEEGFWQDD